MKNNIVLKQIGDFPATVVRSFDEKKDAQEFARLLLISETNKSISYYTAENVVNYPFF